jgi:hypothetical protein
MRVRYCWESQKERDRSEEQHVGGQLILGWILDRMRCYEMD